jgi:hypothetical protein
VVWWERSGGGQVFARDVRREGRSRRGRIGCEGEKEESEIGRSVEKRRKG